MIIDELRFEDLEDLKAVYDEAFLKESDIEIMKQKFSKISNTENSKMLCVRENDKLVGFLKCDIIDDFVSSGKAYMFLSNLCVSKNHRGKGYSSLLINKAEELAKDFRCEYVFLTCGNQRICAHGVYQKLGYIRKETNVFIKYL